MTREEKLKILACAAGHISANEAIRPLTPEEQKNISDLWAMIEEIKKEPA